MVVIFSKVTCVLSQQFVEYFEAETLTNRLVTLGKDTGLEFQTETNRDGKSYHITGDWYMILQAYRSLEECYHLLSGLYFENDLIPNDRRLANSNDTSDKSFRDPCIPEPYVIDERHLTAYDETLTSDKSDTFQKPAGLNIKCELEFQEGIESITVSGENPKGKLSKLKSPNTTNETVDYFDDSSTDIDENYVQEVDTQSDDNCMPDGSLFKNNLQFKSHKNAKHIEVGVGKLKRKFNTSNSSSGLRKTKKMKSENVIDHPEVAHEIKSEQLSCNLCSYVGKRKNLYEHKMRTHSSNFSCEVCKKNFGYKKDLKRHLKSVHAVENQEKSKIAGEKVEKEVSCNLCSYKGKRNNLKEHRKRKHPLTNDLSFHCNVCQKSFKIKKDLKRHVKRVHNTDPQYHCTLCKKDYRNKRNYTNHLSTHEEGYVKPSFKCDLCNKSFSTKYVLTTHIEAEHRGMKKSFICPTCNRSFTQKMSYVQHAKVHAGIKPYVCDTCGKAFTYEKSLREHKYTHEDIKRFKCEICSKKFRQSTNLNIHLRTHKESKDYTCTVCGKGFTQKQALVRHERIHSGEKPYVCTICNKAFSDYSIVRRHMMLIHKKHPKEWRKGVVSNIIRNKDFFIESGPGQNVVDTPNLSSPKIVYENAKTDAPKVVYENVEIDAVDILKEVGDALRKGSSSKDLRDETDPNTNNNRINNSGLPSKQIIDPDLDDDTTGEDSAQHTLLLPPPYPIQVPNQVAHRSELSAPVLTTGTTVPVVNTRTGSSNLPPPSLLTNCVPLNYSLASSQTVESVPIGGAQENLSGPTENQVMQEAYRDSHRQWSQSTTAEILRGHLPVPPGYTGELTQSGILSAWANQSYGSFPNAPNYPQYSQTSDNSEN